MPHTDPKPHASASETKPYYQQSAEEAATHFQTDSEQGLTADQAAQRLQKFGRNELPEEAPIPAWKRFIAQFKDVLVILLLVATVISLVLWLIERDTALPYEAIAILAIILLNAVMGFVQEARATSAVSALRQVSAAHAKVIRDGQLTEIEAADLVPGDLIELEEGDTIPADARVVRSTAMQIAEAALTGESQPVSKDDDPITHEVALGDRFNMLFSGTHVTYGRGYGIVTGTGTDTELGRIAGLLHHEEDEPTPLQKELNRVGKLLGIIVVAIAVIMVLSILLLKEISGMSEFLDVLILAVALAVAAVPEGLPTVVTAVLAVGVQRMARRKAIIRHLAAVETLGSADVVASDKTGTLTRNEMTVRKVVTASGTINLGGTGYEPAGEITVENGDALEGDLAIELNRILAAADLANNAVVREEDGRWIAQGDPTEAALIVAARKTGIDEQALSKRLDRIAEVPFSSERKLMTTIHSDAEETDRVLVFTKGAPDVLLARCTRELTGEETRELTPERREELNAINNELAAQALRTLGIAARAIPAKSFSEDKADTSLEKELIFLGLVGIIDPPREEARHSVQTVKRAGIRPMMITGDHPATALVIAEELGIAENDQVLSGLQIEKMSDSQLQSRVNEVSVYARVNPEHKLRIVNAIQANGSTVAMTGDGVNDAPALKSANIGVAMGITGTDVSKQAADIVLVDDNYSTIVAAVEEGRTIFANIRKFLRYLLSSNIGEVLTMFLGLLVADWIGLTSPDAAVVLPLLATQILWINLVTDAAPALALGLDPFDQQVMNQPPRPSSEGVITGQMWRGIFFVGLIMALGTLFVIDLALPGGFFEGNGTLAYGQTMAFTTLMLFQLFNVFNARSDTETAFHGLFANLWLWAAAGLSLLLHFAVIYVPFLQRGFSTVTLSMNDWLICTVVASLVLWLREIQKLLVRLTVSRTDGDTQIA